MDSQQVLHIHYKQPSAVAEFTNASTYRVLISAIKKYAPSGARILDVGCGRGELLKYASDIGYVMNGCDMDETCVKMGAEYGKVQCLSVDELSPEKFDGKFEIVVMSHVLEHVENPKDTIRKLALLSNKYLLISVPNPYYLPNIIKSLIRLPVRNVNSGHLYSWDWFHFKTFIEIGCGLKVMEWFYDSVAIPLPGAIRSLLVKMNFLPIIEDRIMGWLLPRFCRSITAIIEIK